MILCTLIILVFCSVLLVSSQAAQARVTRERVIMTDLPVIRSYVIRKGFWDRQGANIASRSKEMYGVKLFLRQKQRFSTKNNIYFRRDFVRSGGN